MKCQHSPGTNSANIHIACGPFFELDYDESIRRAKSMFNEIYPNDEFLPRAPDPEEIIIEGDAAPARDAGDDLQMNANDSSLVDASDTTTGDGDSQMVCADLQNDGSIDTCSGTGDGGTTD